MTDTFKGEKRVADDVLVKIDCSQELALFEPADVVSTCSWAVEDGTVTLSNDSINGNTVQVQVAGGTKLYSWHSIRATITTAAGQVYTPLIEIQLIR